MLNHVGMKSVKLWIEKNIMFIIVHVGFNPLLL